MSKFSPEEQLAFQIEKRVRKAIDTYGLIQDGDHLLVGFSGGKDSYALIEMLAKRAKIFHPRFKVSAVHIVMTNISYESDLEAMRDFCESRGVTFYVRETSFDESTDHRKSPCFLCSWNRRKMLFDTAQELGCSKIALGHHKDDILQTLLMNMTFHGNIGTMPPKLKMSKFEMTLIRPLALVDEEMLIQLQEYRQYPLQKKNCPHERSTHRA
jgi:tRNA 2-thiocytidine biosynthesis protein TtcA